MEILDTDEVVFFLDNKPLQDSSFEGKMVYNPKCITSLSCDKILLMSTKWFEMKCQLLELGVSEDKIVLWNQYYGDKNRGIITIYTSNINTSDKKNILLMSVALDYNGGSIAIVYAARVLSARGYNVWLTAPDSNEKFIREIRGDGINIALCPTLPYIDAFELTWIKKFDMVIVNTFQMLRCAVDISYVRPVLWWVHEPSEVYQHCLMEFSDYAKSELFGKINVVPVSNITMHNFSAYFPGIMYSSMPYGIVDAYQAGGQIVVVNKVVFAVIGTVSERKGQDVFLSAIKHLSAIDRENAEFWLIGFIGEDTFSQQTREQASLYPEVKIMELLTRKELMDIYPHISVVVMPSREDPMPIAVTEGMMQHKVCIVSDATGQAEYIEDGVNGFIFPLNQVNVLRDKMRWIIHNSARLISMREKSRKIYDTYFAMDVFAACLEKNLRDTELRYQSND